MSGALQEAVTSYKDLQIEKLNFGLCVQISSIFATKLLYSEDYWDKNAVSYHFLRQQISMYQCYIGKGIGTGDRTGPLRKKFGTAASNFAQIAFF